MQSIMISLQYLPESHRQFKTGIQLKTTEFIEVNYKLSTF